MRIALSVWGCRISPVFDVARSILVVELSADGEQRREFVSLSGPSTLARTRLLLGLSPDVIICGAISAGAAALLGSAGPRLHAWIAGDVEAVLRAFLEGELSLERFGMPGCCGCSRRGR